MQRGFAPKMFCRVLLMLGLSLSASSSAFAQNDESMPEMPPAQAALHWLDSGEIRNAYIPFARYALNQALRRQRGETLRSAVLEGNDSLASPRTITCGNKPLAAIIDLDIAPGTPAQMEIERQNGFAELLQSMRDAGIRIAWLADSKEFRLLPILTLLQEGDEPVMRNTDLMLIGLPGSSSKQDRRQQLAQGYCILAIAGDRKADFDELFDFLRDQNYAIRLESFTDRGWFLLPHPVAAIDSERLEISPDTEEVDNTP